MMLSFFFVIDYFASTNKCILSSAAEIMANYANRSQKRDAKGKGKVGTSGPPPAPIPVPGSISVSSTRINVSAAALVGPAASSGGNSPAGKSAPPSTGIEVAPVPPKRRGIPQKGMLLFSCSII
jgi:hypothetical protein